MTRVGPCGEHEATTRFNGDGSPRSASRSRPSCNGAPERDGLHRVAGLRCRAAVDPALFAALPRRGAGVYSGLACRHAGWRLPGRTVPVRAALGPTLGPTRARAGAVDRLRHVPRRQHGDRARSGPGLRLRCAFAGRCRRLRDRADGAGLHCRLQHDGRPQPPLRIAGQRVLHRFPGRPGVRHMAGRARDGGDGRGHGAHVELACIGGRRRRRAAAAAGAPVSRPQSRRRRGDGLGREWGREQSAPELRARLDAARAAGFVRGRYF